MKNFINHNKTAIMISAATFALAAIAIFTAWRLYRMQSTAPQPSEAQEQQQTTATPQPITESCNGLTFAISVNAQETSPTPSLTPSPTPNTTSSPTSSPTTAPSSFTTNAPASPSATPTAELPEAGVSAPTLIGVGFGTLLLLLALALAI